MRPPTQTMNSSIVLNCITHNSLDFSMVLCYTHSFLFSTGLVSERKKHLRLRTHRFSYICFSVIISVVARSLSLIPKQTSMQNVQIPDIAYERFMFLTYFAPCMCFCRLDQSHNAVLVLQNTVPYYHAAHTHTHTYQHTHALHYSQKYTV